MKKNSKTSLFLMELIIVILFFSIAAVVCVQLFVNAYTTNESTKRTSQSNIILQNIAEQFLGCDGDLDAVSKLYESNGAHMIRAGKTDGAIGIGYDEHWAAIPAEDAPAYLADISVTDASGNVCTPDTPASPGDMLTATIKVYDMTSGACIASQEVKHYVPYRPEAGR